MKEKFSMSDELQFVLGALESLCSLDAPAETSDDRVSLGFRVRRSEQTEEVYLTSRAAASSFRALLFLVRLRSGSF